MSTVHTIFAVFFWLCFAAVVYAYAIYPVLLVFWARFRKSSHVPGPRPQSVSIVLAAHNEETTIRRRIEELTGALEDLGLPSEFILVSDGSTDATADIAREFSKARLRVLELPTNAGKAVALSAGCALARYEVVVFADARQTWAPHALERLLEPFSDASVGAVSGDLVVRHGPGAMAGVGLYWRYEKWVRRLESRVHSLVSVTGAISAVRRELFRPIPPGTILDDMYWPLQVTLQGYRVVHADGATAYDRLPDSPRDEFRRKVRTLSGNYQLFARLPSALLPAKNPVWFQLVSHKAIRLFVPWALLAMLTLGVFLPGADFRFLLWCQASFYAAALGGIRQGCWSRLRPVSAAASFVILNSAAWVAFWVWATGRTTRTWGKVAYNFS